MQKYQMITWYCQPWPLQMFSEQQYKFTQEGILVCGSINNLTIVCGTPVPSHMLEITAKAFMGDKSNIHFHSCWRPPHMFFFFLGQIYFKTFSETLKCC